MYWTTSSGKITLNITKNQARVGYHSGACDCDIAELRNVPAIARQLRKINPSVLEQELREYSDWDTSVHDANLSRVLWLACGDIAEGALC